MRHDPKCQGHVGRSAERSWPLHTTGARAEESTGPRIVAFASSDFSASGSSPPSPLRRTLIRSQRGRSAGALPATYSRPWSIARCTRPGSSSQVCLWPVPSTAARAGSAYQALRVEPYLATLVVQTHLVPSVGLRLGVRTQRSKWMQYPTPKRLITQVPAAVSSTLVLQRMKKKRPSQSLTVKSNLRVLV